MARDRKRHAQNGELPAMAAPPAAVLSSPTLPPNAPIAATHQAAHHQDQILALVRALARDEARADHARDIAANRRHRSSDQ